MYLGIILTPKNPIKYDHRISNVNKTRQIDKLNKRVQINHIDYHAIYKSETGAKINQYRIYKHIIPPQTWHIFVDHKYYTV